MENTDKDNQLDSEWEQRVLCSDESCIGVIGPDGRCKACGSIYEGELPDFSATSTESDTSEASADDHAQAPDESADDTPAATPVDGDEWDQRTLCRDENCIGVIGPDGRCKECGKPY